MNIRPMLSKKGYEPHDGELGMIDYDIVKLGEKLSRQFGDKLVEMMITEWESDQVFIYSFFDHGFSIRRWVKK